MNVVAAARDTPSWRAMSLGRAPSGPPWSTAATTACARCDSPKVRNARSPARWIAWWAAATASVSWSDSSERSAISDQPSAGGRANVNMLIVNILISNGARRKGVSAGLRPVHLRHPPAPRAFQGEGLPFVVLALVAGGTDGVRRDHVVPSPEGG